MEPKQELNLLDLKAIAILFVIAIIIISMIKHSIELEQKANEIKQLNTQILKLNVELTEIKEHYLIAVSNLNSMNEYTVELEDKLSKLEKLDKVYKEIGRIYNK